MAFKNILLEQEDKLAIVTINRREKMNALNQETLQELWEAFGQLAADEKVMGILVTGSGSKAFAAGADIEEIRRLDLESGREFALFGQRVYRRIETLRKPVIALINGYALGGGCELAMACHLRLAGENAKLGQPEVNLGLIPGYGGTQRLPRLVGRGVALQLLLTAEMIDAGRAYQLGLVNKVVPSDQLLDSGKEMLGQILGKGPLAVQFVLETVHRGLDMTLEEGLNTEADFFGMACNSGDMKEGIDAFLQKRRAEFKGK